MSETCQLAAALVHRNIGKVGLKIIHFDYDVRIEGSRVRARTEIWEVCLRALELNVLTDVCLSYQDLRGHKLLRSKLALVNGDRAVSNRVGHCTSDAMYSCLVAFDLNFVEICRDGKFVIVLTGVGFSWLRERECVVVEAVACGSARLIVKFVLLVWRRLR